MVDDNTPIPLDDEMIPAAIYEPNNDTEREGLMENSDDSEGFCRTSEQNVQQDRRVIHT